MTHQAYTEQQLQTKTLTDLKTIYTQIGATVEITDKRTKSAWINAIILHQTSQTEKLSGGIRQIEQQEIIDPNFQANYDKAITAGFIFTQEAIGHDNGIRWVARLGQYKCHNSKLSTVASLAAQYIGSPLHQRHINQTQDHNTRLENNRQGYKDAIAGLAMQSNDPCYRVGYDRGIRDTRPQTEDTSSDAIVFEEIGQNIYSKIWQATVNNIEIRIIPVNGGYKSNLTGDRLLIDFGIAVKETLLAVAELQTQQTERMEIYTTATPGLYAVYSHKPNQTNRYEVNLEANTCTCPHHQYRHHQEGFKDKHIIYVRAALTIRTTPPIREEEMLLDKPFDELTAADLERLASYNPLPELVAA